MPLSGILRTWKDDRGYGFIAPSTGGNDLFVHVSAFPRDGQRPREGERLYYELGRGKDGKPQAIRISRSATAATSVPRPRGRSSSAWGRLAVPALVLLGLGGYAVDRHREEAEFAARPVREEAEVRMNVMNGATTAKFECGNRTRCTQMSSCKEAKWVLRHCPGTRMDGDHDGVPCESQFCNGDRP